MQKKKRPQKRLKTGYISIVVSILFLTLAVGFAAMELIDTGLKWADFFTKKLEPEAEPVLVIGLPLVDNYPKDTEDISEVPYLFDMKGVTYLSVGAYRMILVNREFPIPDDYNDKNQDADAALEAMDSMISGAKSAGISIWVQSGYRSYGTQASIHDRYIQKYGQEYAGKISAEAGHSEHQTGLAFDLNGEHGGGLSETFSYTPEYEWLMGNAEKYGFILRFPKGKEWATGYAYEPWHYRYVGPELAKIINETGLSVEEVINEPWNPQGQLLQEDEE